jgi:hypothetical protein
VHASGLVDGILQVSAKIFSGLMFLYLDYPGVQTGPESASELNMIETALLLLLDRERKINLAQVIFIYSKHEPGR